MPALPSNTSCVDIKVYYAEDWSSDPLVSGVFILMYGIILTCSVGINFFVLCKVARKGRYQKARSVFTANHALADLFLVVCCLPVTAHYLINKSWTFGRAVCGLLPFFQCIGVLTSALSLTATSVDRCLSISNSNSRDRRENPQAATVVSILLWIMCTVFASPLVVSTVLVDGDHFKERAEFKISVVFCGQMCIEDWQNLNFYGDLRQFYGISLLILQFLLPLSITSVCYHFIGTRTREIAASRTLIVKRSSLLSLQHLYQKNRLHRLTGVFFFISWAPLVMMNTLRDFNSLPEVISSQEYFCGMLAHCVAMSATIWSPLFYVLRNFHIVIDNDNDSEDSGSLLPDEYNTPVFV